jgi:hypothetical protein
LLRDRQDVDARHKAGHDDLNDFVTTLQKQKRARHNRTRFLIGPY